MEDFIGISIVGVIVSLLMQTIKKYMGANSIATRWMTVLVAGVFGGLYAWLRTTPYWQSALGVLAAASTVYAFILKK